MQETETNAENTGYTGNNGHAEGQVSEEQMAQGINTDENMAGTQLLDDDMTDDTESPLKAELAEAKDKYLRLAAEFDNYKRRTSRERLDLIQTAGREVIAAMLDVLDDSERAAKQLETSNDLTIIKEGVSLVFAKLKNTLLQKGLKAMESHGADFDPELHEAITEIPSTDMQGKVVDVIQTGYYLNDKLIRHAKVVVGK